MPRTKLKRQPSRTVPPNGPTADVLTLREAAIYLRLPELDLVQLVEEQCLPARRVGNEWRFLKGAIQAWLSTPMVKREQHGIWAAAGALRDDPYLDDMLKEIEQMRGRPMTEED